MRQLLRLSTQFHVFFVATLFVCGFTVLLRDDLINSTPESTRLLSSLSQRFLTALDASSSGINACALVNNVIDTGAETREFTQIAVNFFSLRYKNLLLEPLKADTNEAWESYRISLLPLLFPFIVVSIVWVCIWISCLSQMLCSKCCSCCNRDLYKKPYSSQSIFVWMMITIIAFIFAIGTASLTIYFIESAYIGYQQLYCQQQLAFRGFLDGKPASTTTTTTTTTTTSSSSSNSATNDHWIGMTSFSTNIVQVQTTLAQNIHEFVLAFDSQKAFSQYSIEKAALKTQLQTVFDAVSSNTVTDPYPSTASKVNLNDYIVLNGASGFTKANAQILAQYDDIIEVISAQLTSLYDLVKALDTSSADYTTQINTANSVITTFTNQFKASQKRMIDLFENGNSWIIEYREIVIILMSVILFCCVATLITFPIIYFYKVRHLEIVTSAIWIATSVAAILGLLAAGVMYMITNIFYESSISLNQILSDQSTFLSIAYVIDSDSAKYLAPCFFGTANVSMADCFGLTEYLNKVNNVSEYMATLEETIGSIPYPSLVLQKQIESCTTYVLHIDTLLADQVSKKLSLLNACTSKNSCDCQDGQSAYACSSQLLNDAFVFSKSSCSTIDSAKRFQLEKGQENTNYSLKNCITIHTDASKDMNYTLRIDTQRTAIDDSSACQSLQQCTLNHLSRLQAYAQEAGQDINAVLTQLKAAETSFLNLYQTYITLHETLASKYSKLLEASFSLVSNTSTGMQTNLQCSTFATDLQNIANYLHNQYLSISFLMVWSMIATIVIMILGLTAKYLSISRLQFWAHIDVMDNETETGSIQSNSPLLKGFAKWLFTSKNNNDHNNGGDDVNDRSSKRTRNLNETQSIPMLDGSITTTPFSIDHNIDNNTSFISNPSLLKSTLVSQSAYQKKYQRSPEKMPTASKFSYQVSLMDISISEDSPQKRSPRQPQAQQPKASQPYTREQYELEMQEYHG